MANKPPSCEKLQMKECNGRENEYAKGLPNLSKYGGVGNCRTMPKKTGLRRSCGKNSRIRWTNQRANLDQIQSSFSPEEEDLIIKLHATIGSRWTIIAQQLPGKTDNEVKNFWNKKLKKKLTAIGIDPVTHRPFSQILAEYGNIGGCPKTRNHFGLKRDTRNEFMLKSEPSFSPFQSSSDFISHFDARISLPGRESLSKDKFFSNTNHLVNDNGNSLDLLSQLQAITMVTDSTKYRTTPGTSVQIPIECTSSSSASSSPPSSATNKAIASSSFSWCDFLLLEDAFPPTNEQEQENGVKFSFHKKEQETTTTAAENEIHTSNKTSEDSSVSIHGSFVEAMLERETEMLSDFHGLLEEPCYY